MMKRCLSRDEIRNIQLEMLNYIDKVCEETKHKYYLAYGTLLGAIRHKGFIPWDDDIDIYVERSEYKKLLGILQTESIKDKLPYKILDGNEKNYYYPFAKIINSNTCAKMKDNKTEHGIWIDIFPVDNVPDNELARQWFVRKNHILRNIIIAITTDFSGANRSLKTNLKRIINFVAQKIGYMKICNYTKNYNKKYQNKKTKYVACLSGAYGIKEIQKRKVMFTDTKVIFEGKKYSATKYWDEYLRKLYGNYMKIPELKDRKYHDINAELYQK